MDHKWSVIAARSGVKTGIVSAIAWAIMDYASQQENRGDVVGFDVETYAFYSGFSEQEITAVIQAMNDKGIISNGRLANWEKRQPKSEKEIQRVTDYRKRKREERDSYGMLQDVTENYTDTEADAESDKDTDKDKEKREEGRVYGDDPQLEKIYCAVTSQISIPSTNRDSSLFALRAIRRLHKSDEETIVYLRPFYLEWKNGRHYSQSNTGWLTDWAIAGAIPEQRNGKNETLTDVFDRIGRENGNTK